MINNLHPLILNEVSKIEAAVIPSPYHNWSCLLHVADENYRMPLVLQTAVRRDYLENLSDVFKVTVRCDAALYNTVVYPNRDKLKVTLSRKPVYVKGAGEKFDPLYQVEQYIAKLVDAKSNNIVGENPITNNKSNYNTHALIDIELQVTSSVVARLRNMTYHTNHINTSAIEAIRTILTRFTVDGGDREGERVKGVDVADNHSVEKRAQIAIPSNTPLLNAPAIINRYSDSVYSTGFGYYLQNGIWYVFSPYDLKRFERGQYSHSLTIVNVPSNQLPGIEKTYRNTGTQLIVIANGETKHFDPTERNATNEGTGARFVDANRADEQLDSYEDGKMQFKPREFINEFTAMEREEGDVRMSTSMNITGNPRNEYSKLAQRMGTLVGVLWELSAPDLLYPGMPVKYIYLENGLPKSKYGTLVGVDCKDSPANDNVASTIFSTTSYLSIFLEKA